MAKPFTVPHFRAWAADLVLDSGDPWVLEDFQARFLRDIFAGVPETWLIVPEGNAKTTLAGGFVLYHAQHMREARAAVAASSREQAEWLYQAAAGFVSRSESLEKLFRCQEGYRRIRCDSMGSRVQIFAADDRTGDGVIPTLCLLEELHRHRNLNLYRTWRGKLLKRHGQLAAISTAGLPGGEFEETRRTIRETATSVVTKGSYSRIVGKGIVVHEYAVPETDSVENMRDVKKANPLKAIKVADLREKRDTPTMTLPHWRRFVCGQPSSGEGQAILPDQWDVLRADIGNVEDGEEVVLAPSIGGNAAICVAAKRGEKVAFKVFHVDPPEQRSIQAVVEDKISEICGRYDVLDIAFPTSGFVRSNDELRMRSLPVTDAHPSPSRLIAASGTFDRLLFERNLIHDGDEKTRAQILSAAKKVTFVGERYDPQDHSRAIGAIAMAVHAVTGYEDDLTFIGPSEETG